MEVNIGGMKVMMGVSLITTTIPRKTVFSIAETMRESVRAGFDLKFSMGCASNNDRARDIVVDGFLSSDCEKLFWIDADMVWSPPDFFKLVALSTLFDVVAVSYPAKLEGEAPFFVDMESPQKANDYGLIRINGCGLGFTIMDRKVVQSVSDMSPEVYDQSIGRKRKKIFRHDIHEGHDRTEDFAFFADIKECGYGVWLDPQIELGHVGVKEWRGKLADASNVKHTKD